MSTSTPNMLAYVFPGQGSQSVGMGMSLAERFPASKEVFHRVDEALRFPLSELIATGPSEILALTEHTQPAVLAASIAALEAARSVGLPAPSFVAGHSLGEYSALVCAGVLSLEDAAKAVRLRGRFMQEAVPVGQGAMAAVIGLNAEGVRKGCAQAEEALPGKVVVPANFNGPQQIVIAGHKEAVEAASEACKALGARRVTHLPVSAPFHSPLMEPVRARLAQVLEPLSFENAALPLVSNVEATPESRGERWKELLVEQVTSPVRWTELSQELADQGCTTFVELGPGNVLSGLLRRQLRTAQTLSVSNPDQLDAALKSLATFSQPKDQP